MVPVAVVAREHALHELFEIALRSRPELQDRQPGRRVRDEDVHQTVAPAAAEPGDRVGDVEDAPAGRVEVEFDRVHAISLPQTGGGAYTDQLRARGGLPRRLASWGRERSGGQRECRMSTIEVTVADEAEVEQFAEKLFAACLATMELANVELGVRLGLYEALAGAGPTTAGELAKRAGIADRYAQEWLEQQAV